MKLLTTKSAILFLSSLFLLLGPTASLADCKSDISKVEFAIDHLDRSGIDLLTAEKMRALLEDANKQRKAGNEDKCQELINKAKYMGNIE